MRVEKSRGGVRGRKARQGFGAGAAGRADAVCLAGSITQIALSEESMEEGIEWNSALTAAVTMATEEGMKKDTDEISGKLLGRLLPLCPPATRRRWKSQERRRWRSCPTAPGPSQHFPGVQSSLLLLLLLGASALAWGLIPRS